MREIGSAAMPIVPTFNGIKNDLERGLSSPMGAAGTKGGRLYGDSAGKSLTSSLSRHAKKAALLASGALVVGAAGAFKFGADAVSLAADLEQSIGAVDTVFGKSAKRMHKWAKGAANDVGLTRNEFNELGTLIGSQLKNGGTAMDRLAPKTNKLIKLGADLSSMFGGQTSEAVEALSSALKGERDPIERYGVSLNQAKIDAEAAALGFEKVDGALSSEAQQAATLSLIMKQTADAHGNFAKEADTLSGKQQRLKASLEDTKTEIGTALLPIVADAADFLLKEGVPAFQGFADFLTEDGIPALRDFAEDAKPLANEILPAIGDAAGTVKDAFSAAAPFVKDFVGAFNDMPDWATDAAVLGALGLAVGSKVKGGKGGAAALLGGNKGATAANPMYVWVVNGGAGDTPGGGKKGPGAVPLGAPAALLTGATVYFTAKAQTPSTESLFSDIDTSNLDALRDSLETDLGRYAEDLGINLDTLATELYNVGSSSEYVQSTMKKLEGAARPGFWKDLTDGINPFSNQVGDAKTALDNLRDSLDGLDRDAKKRADLAALKAGDKAGNPFANMFGGQVDLAKTLEKLPEGKLKLLQDPATVQTREDVRKLLGDVDGLNRGDFKLLFKALGLEKAKQDAKTLLDYMTALNGLNAAGGAIPEGFNGPFRQTRTSTGAAALGRLSVGSINVQANDVDRLVGELTEISRRTAIGGY